MIGVRALTPSIENGQNHRGYRPILSRRTGIAFSNIHSALSILKVFSRFISYLRILPQVNAWVREGQLLQTLATVFGIQSTL